jgi:predicted N-acetyltransferase YhbS
VEYLIRPARITDIDRLAAIGEALVTAAGRTGALVGADLLRQLTYLPHASVFVAQAGRELAGGAVLILRPSVVAGGYVGTVDMLVVAPEHDAERVTDALMEELLRSASNKGCSAVETNQPDDPASLARLERNGFAPAGILLRRPVSAAGSSSGRA